MANNGFFCSDGYLKRTAKLSDQELGRLFRACMVYHATGQVTELAGRESVAFDFIREDIDAANEKYAAKCETNRENIRKRWDDTNGYDRIRTDTNASEAVPNDTNATKVKVKVNTKVNSLEDDDNARATQEDHNRIFDAAEDAGFTRSESVRDRLVAMYVEYGLEKVLAGIASCVEHNAPTLAYLAAVLRGGEQKKAKQGKVIAAQNYPQRDYSEVERMQAERQRRRIEERLAQVGSA